MCATCCHQPLWSVLLPALSLLSHKQGPGQECAGHQAVAAGEGAVEAGSRPGGGWCETTSLSFLCRCCCTCGSRAEALLRQAEGCWEGQVERQLCTGGCSMGGWWIKEAAVSWLACVDSTPPHCLLVSHTWLCRAATLAAPPYVMPLRHDARVESGPMRQQPYQRLWGEGKQA